MWALGIGYFADSGGQRGNSVASKSIGMSQDRETAARVSTNNETRSDSSNQTSSEPNHEIEMPTDMTPEPRQASAPAESELSMPQESETNLSPQSVTIVDLEPQRESKELVETVEMGTKMLGRIAEMSGDDEIRPRALTVTYRTLAKAGALAKSNGPHLQELAQTIKASPVLDDLEAACSDWMDTRKRDNEGVILIGQSDGGAVMLGSGKRITVSGTPSLPADGRVMVIGQILDSKSVNAVLVESLP